MTECVNLRVWAETPYAQRLLGWLSRHVETEIYEGIDHDNARRVVESVTHCPDWVFHVLNAQASRTFNLYQTMTGPARWYWYAASRDIDAARSYLARAHSDK